MDELVLLGITSLTMTVIALALSYLSWSGSKRNFRIAFVALMFFEALIGWSYYLDTAAATIDEKLFWNNLEYAGYLGATVCFVLFALSFTGSKYATKKVAFFLGAPAVVFQLIVASNSYHHLFYSDVDVSENLYKSFDAVYGPLFFIFATFVLSMVLLGNLVLMKHYIRSPKAHRSSVGLVMFCGLISLVAVILNYALIDQVPGGVIIMVGFIAGCVPLFIGAFSFELFEMLPFATERVMDTMQDSVLILDELDRVLFMNRSAERLSGFDINSAYGLDISIVLPVFPTNAFDITNVVRGQISRPVLKVEKGYYEMDVSPIRDQGGSPMGKMVLIRDITLRKNFEEDARLTHEKLDLLNSITRHDIKNQLVMLEGRINLVKAKVTDPEIGRHLDAGMRTVKNIERQISFAKDYQELGRSTPAWQSLDNIFYNIGQLLDLRKVKVSVDTKEVEILADPLLAKVFYNLVDNSLTHGELVSNISILASEIDGNLEIVYQDDGIGVPLDNKKVIFDKGMGRNSGFGLFLSKEILRIGGMDIKEDGVPGKGARFRITIPKGSYRFLSS